MKERLTGAIILVALIVLLVPELLTGPIRMKSAPGASPAAVSPPVARAATAEAPLRSYTLTLGATPPAREPAAAPAVTPPVQPADISTQGPPQSSAQSPPQDSVNSPAGSPRESASEGGNGGANEPNDPQPARPPDDTAAKVRSTHPRQRGTRAEPSLQGARSPTHLAERDSRPPASSSGWVVQLGSFVSRQNADRLAHSLAGKGFHMSVSPARTGSRVLWRVRAGPAHDRAGAQRLATRLRALGHRGELLSVR